MCSRSAASNPPIALLTVNVLLIAHGVSMVAYSAVPPADQLTDIRGVWELHRVELLADRFAAQPSA